VNLRVATPSDYPAIAALVNAAFEVEAFFVTEPRTSEEEVRTIACAGTFLLAETEPARLVGAVKVTLHGSVGHFGMLSVAPGVQGRGLGRRIVAAAERRMLEHGASTSEITVVNVREELFPWYRRLGYRSIGTEPYVAHRPPKIPVHFVVMQKQLAPSGAGED